MKTRLYVNPRKALLIGNVCFCFQATLDRSPLNNAWKIYNFKKEKWYIFFTKKAAHKERWIKAFKDERRRVKEDAKTGNYVSLEGDLGN